MRIPHIINNNTLLAYEPSSKSLNLLGESDRKIVSENFLWNSDHLPSLTDKCVEAISKNFEKEPLLDELPCENRDYLLEILSADLSLERAIPIISDEYYWQRRYKTKFGVNVNRKPPFQTWKSLYLERHVQDILEHAQPQYSDEENMNEILNLCSPYVKRVIVSQLQCWKPPLTMEKEDVPEVYPLDHINFAYIFQKLPLVTEFDLVYGMNDVSGSFHWNMFKISIADCQRLGKALLDLKQLRILRIHRSKLEYRHCQSLMQGLIKNRSLVELDLSNCLIGDQGALCVAKVLGVHPSLKKLNLSNNSIGRIGAEGIGFTLLLPNCANLDVLNLRLNPLGKDGTMGIMRALVRCKIPKELSVSGCDFQDDTPIKISQMLKINVTLQKFDVSSNWFGDEGGNALVEAMEINTTLEWLDIRDTDISNTQQQRIKNLLIRNRTGISEPEVEDFSESKEDKEMFVRDIIYNKLDEAYIDEDEQI